MTDQPLTPFDFIKAVTHTKENLFENHEVSEKEYSAYTVNKGLSYFADCVLYANEMNMYRDIPIQMQFEYYRNSIRSKARFSKWNKQEKTDDLDLVCKEYNCNPIIAKQYLSLLSEEQLSKLRSKYTLK